MAKKKSKNPDAVRLGRLGGSKKVPKGFAMIGPEKREAVQRASAAARWPKKKGKKAK